MWNKRFECLNCGEIYNVVKEGRKYISECPECGETHNVVPYDMVSPPEEDYDEEFGD